MATHLDDEVQHMAETPNSTLGPKGTRPEGGKFAHHGAIG